MAQGGCFPIQNGNLFPFFSYSNCSCPLELTFGQNWIMVPQKGFSLIWGTISAKFLTSIYTKFIAY